MNLIKYILLLLVAAMAITVQADNGKTLTFVNLDGSSVSFSASGLVITYDDQAHALIKNDVTSGTVDLSLVDYMCFGDVEVIAITGDVNADQSVNISDLNLLISIILGASLDDDTMARADVNSDSTVNISDINAIIEIILNQ